MAFGSLGLWVLSGDTYSLTIVWPLPSAFWLAFWTATSLVKLSPWRTRSKVLKKALHTMLTPVPSLFFVQDAKSIGWYQIPDVSDDIWSNAVADLSTVGAPRFVQRNRGAETQRNQRMLKICWKYQRQSVEIGGKIGQDGEKKTVTLRRSDKIWDLSLCDFKSIISHSHRIPYMVYMLT